MTITNIQFMTNAECRASNQINRTASEEQGQAVRPVQSSGQTGLGRPNTVQPVGPVVESSQTGPTQFPTGAENTGLTGLYNRLDRSIGTCSAANPFLL